MKLRMRGIVAVVVFWAGIAIGVVLCHIYPDVLLWICRALFVIAGVMLTLSVYLIAKGPER